MGVSLVRTIWSLFVVMYSVLLETEAEERRFNAAFAFGKLISGDVSGRHVIGGLQPRALKSESPELQRSLDSCKPTKEKSRDQ